MGESTIARVQEKTPGVGAFHQGIWHIWEFKKEYKISIAHCKRIWGPTLGVLSRLDQKVVLLEQMLTNDEKYKFYVSELVENCRKYRLSDNEKSIHASSLF